MAVNGKGGSVIGIRRLGGNAKRHDRDALGRPTRPPGVSGSRRRAGLPGLRAGGIR